VVLVAIAVPMLDTRLSVPAFVTSSVIDQGSP
jgi:hypothetical protein